MNRILILLIFFTIGCSKEKTTTKISKSKELTKTEFSSDLNKYDFNSDSIGFTTPKGVAIAVIDFLQKKDTSKYIETAIPLNAQKYLFAQNFEFRPDIKNKKDFIKWLESRFDKRMDNFLVRAGYITKIMKDDKGFEINQAIIDTITIEDVRIKNYGGFKRFIVGEWADVTVKMSYKKKEYFFEIPQIIKLKDKWFLYYPEFYLRTKEELEFVKKRVLEINQKADEFWL